MLKPIQWSLVRTCWIDECGPNLHLQDLYSYWGVGICPRVLLLYLYVTLSVQSNPEAVCIYYILLAAIGTVSGVFAYYPHPGGQV